MTSALLRPSELAMVLVDSATIYGPDPSSETDAYTVPLLTLTRACRITGRTQGNLATGVGSVQVPNYHMMYSPAVTLPDGYWELESAGTRYAPIANTAGVFRDLAGNVVWKTLDLDQLQPLLH